MSKNVKDFFNAIGIEDLENIENAIAQVAGGILLGTIFVVVMCLGGLFD